MERERESSETHQNCFGKGGKTSERTPKRSEMETDGGNESDKKKHKRRINE